MLHPSSMKDRPKLIKASLVAAASISIVVLLFSMSTGLFSNSFAHTSIRSILDAIRQVESSGNDNCPDGDGGKAIGPFQIHFVYWQDAVEATPSLGGDHSYQDCRKRDYAEQVVESYMKRWAPLAWESGNAETLARIHNGGPNGHKKDSTIAYWNKVKRELEHED